MAHVLLVCSIGTSEFVSLHTSHVCHAHFSFYSVGIGGKVALKVTHIYELRIFKTFSVLAQQSPMTIKIL